MTTDNTKQNPTSEVELSEEMLEGINGGIGPFSDLIIKRHLPIEPEDSEVPKDGGATGSW